MDTTLTYYDQHAQAFCESTAGVEFTAMQDRFLALLPAGGSILDFGCGSGRDVKYFLSRGFAVEATDGSTELCRRASELTGIAVRHELFQDLADVARFDGIWACSSILHLTSQEIPSVLGKMHTALKPNGVIYTSFKYGTFEGERNGRYFTDFTEETFRTLIEYVEGFTIIDLWRTSDVRPGRGDEQWLNCLLFRR